MLTLSFPAPAAGTMTLGAPGMPVIVPVLLPSPTSPSMPTTHCGATCQLVPSMIDPRKPELPQPWLPAPGANVGSPGVVPPPGATGPPGETGPPVDRAAVVK